MLDDKLKQQIFLEIAMPICTREKVMLMHKFVQHGKTSCLEHSIAVAYNSFLMAEAMGTEYDRESLIRGGLLHDYFLYDFIAIFDSRNGAVSLFFWKRIFVLLF